MGYDAGDQIEVTGKPPMAPRLTLTCQAYPRAGVNARGYPGLDAALADLQHPRRTAKGLLQGKLHFLLQIAPRPEASTTLGSPCPTKDRGEEIRERAPTKQVFKIVNPAIANMRPFLGPGGPSPPVEILGLPTGLLPALVLSA